MSVLSVTGASNHQQGSLEQGDVLVLVSFFAYLLINP
jgi:hypothetical protein